MSAQVFFSQILATSDKPVCPHWHERKALSFQFTRPSTDTYFVLRQKTEPRFNISFPCYYYLDSSRWRDLSDSNHVYEYSGRRSEEHTSELQSRPHLVCRLLLEKKKK